MGVILKRKTIDFTNEHSGRSSELGENLPFVRFWLRSIGPEISVLRHIMIG